MHGRTDNPYRDQVAATLPRVLAMFEANPLSPAYGLGDRMRWAWKTVDFGNGTYQGAAHGLARLLSAGIVVDNAAEAGILKRIGAIIEAAGRLRARDGSFSEAFPNESSFCVTALVAHDLLVAVELLGERLSQRDRDRYLDVIAPMIRYLHKHDETHGLISNHLATAAAALLRWTRLTGEQGTERGKKFLARILENQSAEGWFREYEGADPGYQSLCLHYLADVHLAEPSLGLREPLRRSMQFLWNFAHPDGSFGGLYGSRNTRFYYPGGIEALAAEIPEAAALAQFMRSGVGRLSVVGLTAMDEPNLVPMFNSYCWAAVLHQKTPILSSDLTVPALDPRRTRQRFDEAGLVIDRGPLHHTIISWRKGGVCYHFAGSRGAITDGGAAAKDAKGHVYTTQAYSPENRITWHDDETLSIEARMVEFKVKLPTPLDFIILRTLSLTLFRLPLVRSAIKKMLVRILITRKRRAAAVNRRLIRLGPALQIEDEWADNTAGLKRIETPGPFVAVHMASQGYWQTQDEAA